LRDINDAGQIIGAKSNGLTGADAVTNPFILRDGKLTDLGSLGGKTGSVNGINSFGTVVGASQLADGKTNHAFVWSNGALADLNNLLTKPLTYEGAAVVLTSAVSVNNFGDIAATGTFTYKDTVTGKDATGTRSYELKGIANNIAPVEKSAATSAIASTIAPSPATPAIAGASVVAPSPATPPVVTLAPTQLAQVVSGNTPAAVTSTTPMAATTVSQEMAKVTGTVVAAGDSIKPAETINPAQLLTGSGIGNSTNLNNVSSILGQIESLFADLQQYKQLLSNVNPTA
jgi:probable HAF family extracellular repeat protein